MLLIGIDEAGYGPRLGPLCHGFCAIRCPDDPTLQPPDLWKLLKPTITRCPAKSNRFTVDDSKKIYAGGVGLELLAHNVRAFMDCLPAQADSGTSLYCRLLPEADRARLAEDVWDGTFNADVHPPASCEDAAAEKRTGRGASAIQPLPLPPPSRGGENKKAKAKPHELPDVQILRDALARAGVNVLACGARALSARHYNVVMNGSGNKAEVNWSVIAEQLRGLLQLALPGELVHAVIDRQGGRKFYAAKINALFTDAFAWVELETPQRSLYKVESAGRVIRVEFLVDADGQTLPVALGSMAAKLARELCMQRLNAYFLAHSPELKPTAGYYGDAARFLKETRALRQKLGISNESFIRVK